MRVLNQTARVAVHVHAYERMKLVRVTAFTVELVAGLYRMCRIPYKLGSSTLVKKNTGSTSSCVVSIIYN